MATIKSQMVLGDGVSGVLKKINKALNVTLNCFEQVQRASGQAVDTAQIHAARSALAAANREVDQMAEGYRLAAQQEEALNKGLRSGANAADGLLGKVKGIVATLAAGAGLKSILGLSDQMTSTTARLEFLLDDGGSIDDLEQKIMASAQRSRAAYLDTASAIASMGANAGRAFESNDELIAFMEQINKQFVIGGATAEGQAAAMLQLTQAMAAGALRGEELNSILENAPGIARAIESYMGVAEGSIKQYAEQGIITAEVVKNAMFAAADETNAKFESMPMTWAQICTQMQNSALTAFDPVLMRINQIANSEQFNMVINGLAMLASVATDVLDLLIDGASFVVDNWSCIGPIVYGLVAAFMAYNVVAIITHGINAAMALIEGVKAAATMMATGATFAETAAQYGLNAALLACPLTWIIILIIALAAAVYGAVAAINDLAGTSISATGIICGAFMTALAFIGNLFVTLCNLIIDVFVLIYNLIASVANFIGNVFNDPIGSVCRLFFDLADTVLGVLQALASAIDTIFGSNLAGSVQGWRDSLGGWVDETFGKGEEIMAKLNADDLHLGRFEYGAAFDAGYAFGEGVDDKVSGLLDFDLGGGPSQGYGSGIGSGVGTGGIDAFDMGEIAGNTGQIADNTGVAADALTATAEDLEYLRDIAERDAVNRFTTAEVKIDMTGMTNRIEGGADLDGVISMLTDGFAEALVTAAEGVHE